MTVFILPFEKMHGLGNDFIMLERRHLPNGVNDSALAKLLCDRHFSIGGDGIIIVDFPTDTESDFKWDYYNSDGSTAEMCGNGMRCFAKYVYEKGFTDKTSFSVSTLAGNIFVTLEEDETITVKLGSPTLPKTLIEKLNVNSQEIEYTYIEVGNPHCVIFYDDFIAEDIFYELGPIIEKHKNFPKGVNVEFAQVINSTEINLRVWERGAGPTLACGTGACATLIAANLNNLTENKSKINLPGGSLNVFWDKVENIVYLNGHACTIFSGVYNLNPALVCKS